MTSRSPMVSISSTNRHQPPLNRSQSRRFDDYNDNIPGGGGQVQGGAIKSNISSNEICNGGDDTLPAPLVVDRRKLPLPKAANVPVNTKHRGSYEKKKKDLISYEKIELFDILVSRKSNDRDKVAVLKAIRDSPLYGPRDSTLRSWFPRRGEHYNDDVIKQLLQDHRMGGKDWLAKVDAISKSIFGPNVDKIYSIFGYTDNQDSIDNEMRIDKIGTTHQQEAVDAQQLEHMICTDEKRIEQQRIKAKQITPDEIDVNTTTAGSTFSSVTAIGTHDQVVQREEAPSPPVIACLGGSLCGLCCGSNTSSAATTLKQPTPVRPPPASTPAVTRASNRKRPIESVEEEPQEFHDTSQPDTDSAIQLLSDVMKGNGVANVGMQNLAYLILESCTDKKTGDIELKRYTSNKSYVSAQYRKVTQKRSLKANASSKSQTDRIKKTVNDIEKMLVSIKDDNDPEYKKKVLQRLAEKHEYLLMSVQPLTPSQLVAGRDWIGTGTNGMYRTKQWFETYYPELTGKFFPPCIRKVMSEKEKEGVVSVKAMEVNCTITRKGNRRGNCTYYYVENPTHLLEIMVNRMILDGSYETSFDFCSLVDQLVVSFGFDKSENDFVGTMRVLNRREGNSALFVQSFACLEGPVAETYDNELKTVFNPTLPTRAFVRDLADDFLQCLIFTIGAGSDLTQAPTRSVCAMFIPIPTLCPCRRRPLTVKYRPLPINESMVEFDSPPDIVGSTPKIPIPVDVKEIDIRLIHDKDDASIMVGYQVIIDEVVVSNQRLNSQFELGDNKPADVEVCCKQTNGHLANDLKQVLILTGQCSNSVLMPCPCCLALKKELGMRPEWIQRRVLLGDIISLPDLKGKFKDLPEEVIHLIGDYADRPIIPDPKLRVGENSIANANARFSKKTADGKLILTADEYRSLNVETGSAFKPPLIDAHPKKQNCGIMHSPNGHVTHFIDAIASEIRVKMEDSDWYQGVKTALADVQERIKTLKSGIAADDEYKKFLAQSKTLKTKASRLKGQATRLEKSANDIAESISNPSPEQQSQIDQTRQKAASLRSEADDVVNSRIDHAQDTDFGTYNLIRKGLEALESQLKDAIKTESKRPRSVIEYVFYKACESRAGGRFDAKQSGYEMTNGRSMDCLEHFKAVTHALLGIYSPDHPLHKWLEERCPKWEALAAACFDVSTFLKSQKKACPVKCDDLFFALKLAWEAAFPKKGFNKYHALFFEIRRFIHEYHMAGRASEESNEAFNGRLTKAKDFLKRMPSTIQRIELTNARVQSNLNGEILNDKLAIEKKTTGKKRGPQKKRARTSNSVQIISAELEEIQFKGETYMKLTDGNLMPKKFIGYFEYYSAGKAPQPWLDALAKTAPLDFTANQTANESHAKY